MVRLTMILMGIFLIQKAAFPTTVLAAEENGMKIWVATDMHYLAPSLFKEDSGTFQRLLETNDGKVIEKMPEVMEEFTRKVIEEKPDAVLIPGDITMNGEMISLREMKAYFHQMQNAGVSVCVIPGNHDIDYFFAESYLTDEVIHVENISQEEFREEMQDFGIRDSVSADTESFSYLYKLTEDAYVLAIDTNTEQAPNRVKAETLQWMRKALRNLRLQNPKARVISMTHQNVLRASEVLYEGFQISNADEVLPVLKEYGVSWHFSGHSHLQHKSEQNGFTDYCNESMALYPISYAEAFWMTDDSLSYERVEVGVQKEFAKKRFLGRNEDMLSALLAGRGLTEDQIQAMIELAMELNLLTFTGEAYDPAEYSSRPAWTDWTKYASDSFWYDYLADMLSESHK
ncbi:MAG: metallophosphoesterase [Eubacteriales bacterium]|nr:metallophosphoesterase [Eubacteriales bacterium]